MTELLHVGPDMNKWVNGSSSVEKWFLDLQGISKGKYSFQHSESCKRKWFTTGYVSFIPVWLIHYGRLFFFVYYLNRRRLPAVRRRPFSPGVSFFPTTLKRRAVKGWTDGCWAPRWWGGQVTSSNSSSDQDVSAQSFHILLMWGVSSGLSPRDSGKKTTANL